MGGRDERELILASAPVREVFVRVHPRFVLSSVCGFARRAIVGDACFDLAVSAAFLFS